MPLAQAQQYPERDRWYVVEQAIYSPRHDAFQFRFWAYASNLDDARGILRTIPAGRIIYCALMEVKTAK